MQIYKKNTNYIHEISHIYEIKKQGGGILLYKNQFI